MYIKYNNKDYPCTCQPSKNTVIYRGLESDFPYPVDGEIVLCANDGFVLRADNPAAYLRQTFSNGTLTLTNVPEPEIIEPEIVEPNESTEPAEPEQESTDTSVEEV